MAVVLQLLPGSVGRLPWAEADCSAPPCGRGRGGQGLAGECVPGAAQSGHHLTALRLLLNRSDRAFSSAWTGPPHGLAPSLTQPLVLPLPLERSPESPSRRRQHGGF